MEISNLKISKFNSYKFEIQYKWKLICMKSLAKSFQLACKKLAEDEASEARKAFKRAS